jgi:hypothetical protein
MAVRAAAAEAVSHPEDPNVADPFAGLGYGTPIGDRDFTSISGEATASKKMGWRARQGSNLQPLAPEAPRPIGYHMAVMVRRQSSSDANQFLARNCP